MGGKALVTGARGFLGSLLVEDLLKRGYRVSCLLRRGPLKWLDGLDLEVFEGDVTQPQSLNSAVKDVDVVFHLAGVTKAHNAAAFERINAGGTANLLTAIEEAGGRIHKFILVSSLAAAGPSRDGLPMTETQSEQPVSNYGRSKLAAEKITLDFSTQFPVSIVRPPAVYGPRDVDFLNVFKQARSGLRVELGGGPRFASLIYAKDLVEGIRLAAEKGERGEVYYLTGAEAYSWQEIEGILDSVLNCSPRRITIPLPLAFLVSLGFDLYGRLSGKPMLFNVDKYHEFKATHWICSNEKARECLGFEAAHSLPEGMQETADWYKKQGWL